MTRYSLFDAGQKSGYKSGLMDNFWLSTSIWALCHLAREYWTNAQLQLAHQTYQQALKLSPEKIQLPALGLAYSGLGQISYEWDDFASAARHLENALYLFSDEMPIDYVFETYLTLALIKDKPQVWLEKAAALTSQRPDLAAILATYEVQIALAHHDLTIGTRWFDSCDLQKAAPLEILTYLKMLLLRGEVEESLDLIEAQLLAARGLYQLKLIVLQAETYHTFGETAQAVSILSALLSSTESEGFIRLYLDAGQLLTDLLKGVLTTRYPVSTRYTNKLLEAMNAAPLPESPALASTTHPLIDPLTDREREVLEYLAAGYSNRDMAQILFVSEGTIKTHIKSIYSKMDVHSRTQAAARARALGILA